MATLTVDEPRDYQIADKEDYPVEAAATIFEGAAVGDNAAGYSRPLVAGDIFQGFAERKVDNSDGAAGDIAVRVHALGRVVVNVVGADITANARPAVYASDDNTFTLTAGANSLIGYVSRWVSGTSCVVEFDAANAQAALQA